MLGEALLRLAGEGFPVLAGGGPPEHRAVGERLDVLLD
jgi:hypothetical protein